MLSRNMWEDTKNLTSALQAPGVEVWCMYGVGLLTPVSYIYDDKYPDSDPVEYVYDDGDNTVDTLSMSQCKRWIGQQEKPVHVTEFRGMPHLDMVFHHKVLALMQQILEGNSDTPEEIDCRNDNVQKSSHRDS
jgi:lecithin-cholesterol acyltransferase